MIINLYDHTMRKISLRQHIILGLLVVLTCFVIGHYHREKKAIEKENSYLYFLEAKADKTNQLTVNLSKNEAKKICFVICPQEPLRVHLSDPNGLWIYQEPENAIKGFYVEVTSPNISTDLIIDMRSGLPAKIHISTIAGE